MVGQVMRSRGGLTVVVALTLAGVACAFAPLADHLGFEFALVLTLVAAFTAPAAGMAGVRLAKDRPLVGALSGLAVSMGALVVPVALILLNGLRRPSCDPWSGSAWLIALPLPTLLLATSLGALVRARSSSTAKATVKLIAIYLASLGPGLWLLWAGPGFFLFDHLFGYFPGPLYDEVVVLSQTVWVWRALTLGWAAVALAGCVRRGGLTVAAALLALALLGVEVRYGEQIGLRSTDASVAQTLGAVQRIYDLEIHHPREWSEEKVAQFTRDAAFRASQVRTALGLVEGEPVRVWVYRSTDEKRRQVGAANTSFAKPWRREIHIHDMGFPHPVLRHELVHAYAGELGPGPFGVPGGLFPNSPLIEGFAVAFDADDDGLTLPQWAKAMRELELAPDVAALMSTAGFFAAAPSRAYTYAGAFIRFLEQHQGRDAVLSLYRQGTLAALGDPAVLVAAFERWLDEVPVDDDERAAAHRRYKRPSVFRRTCAREVGAVTEQASRLAREGRPIDALDAWEDACRMEPDDPALLRGMLRVALTLDDDQRTESIAARLFAHPKLDASLLATTLMELGDAAWKRGELDMARTRFEEAAKLVVDQSTRRAAVARLQALSDPARAKLLEPLLARAQANVEVLFSMDDHLRAHPDDALVAYLLGRQLVQRDARSRGEALLERASGKLEDPTLEKETLRLLVRSASERGDCEASHQAARRLEGQADRALADDWVERCRFEAARGFLQP